MIDFNSRSISIYGNRPRDNDERLAMIAFLEKEKEIDEENATMFEYMNKEHLTKTRNKQGTSMVKRWKKDSLRAIKALQSYRVRYYWNNKPRTWLS